MTDGPVVRLSVKLPEAGAANRRRSSVPVSSRGRIRADGHLDHEHGERKELYATLRFLAVSLAVLAVILFITLYMRQWMQN
jgi:xanthine/uracil permease